MQPIFNPDRRNMLDGAVLVKDLAGNQLGPSHLFAQVMQGICFIYSRGPFSL